MSDPAAFLSLSQNISGLVAGHAPRAVSIHSHRARSSGFIWRPGLIITADEALAEDGEIAVVLPNGETMTASLAGRDVTTDIALLRIDAADVTESELSLDQGGPIGAGALVAVIGAQDGLPLAALGIVALAGGAWRSMRGGNIDARIELDVSLRKSAEGGMVLDAGGSLIGMAVFGPRRRVLVIPSATLARVAARLESHGRIARGYLGLALQPVGTEPEGAGAMVMSVDPRGPGAAAGIRQGDVIVAWDGKPIERVQTLIRGLGPDSIGRVVTLSLRRAGEPVEVSLTIAERAPA